MKRPIVITLLIVALALVCLGIGAVAFFAVNGGFVTNNPFDRLNVPSELEESKSLKIDAEEPLTLNVVNEAGEVTVIGADVDTVQVKVVKTAYDTTQARADAEVKTVKYDIEQNGNTITLKYEIPDSMNFNNNVNTVDFIVTVPQETSVDIDGNMGKVDVSGLQGQVVIDNDFGDVNVEKVDGALEVKTNSGRVDVKAVRAGTKNIDLYSGFGSTYLDQVSGADITVQSNSGTIDVQEVRATKDMELSSDFGNVKFDNGSAASLTVSTQSGSIDLSSVNISGELTIKNDFGDINLEQVKAKSYDTNTNSGSIIIDGAQGSVKAHTGFGNITVKNAESATLDLNTQSGSIEFIGSLGDGPHTIHSDFGEIEVSIPADSALNVDFKTEFGRIRSDIPVTITLTGELNQNQQTGTINGGGSQFNASTKSGNITISVLSQ